MRMRVPQRVARTRPQGMPEVERAATRALRAATAVQAARREDARKQGRGGHALCSEVGAGEVGQLDAGIVADLCWRLEALGLAWCKGAI